MKPSPTFLDAERETRIFHWFMTLILAGMYVWAIATQPELRQPLRLVIFTGLMNVHIILHWMLRGFASRPGWTVGYMVLQGGIFLALVLISRNVGLMFALSLALIGEAIGVYGITKRGLAATGYYLVLSLGSFLWVFGVGDIGWWMLGIIPMLFFVIFYVELYSRQLYANERARKLLSELEIANRQLTDYADQVEDLTIAAERQRMARELHDTLSQGLAGLILQLEAADAHLSSDRPQKARQIVQHTMEDARATLANARQVIDNLRTEDAPDIEGTIQTEVSRFISTSGVPCTLEMDVSPDLPARLCDPIARIVAEALANIARHARATQAYLRLRSHEGELILEICDDGVGFDPAAVPASHYGLVGMQERVRLAGGQMQIESASGRGTILKIKLPIR